MSESARPLSTRPYLAFTGIVLDALAPSAPARWHFHGHRIDQWDGSWDSPSAPPVVPVDAPVDVVLRDPVAVADWITGLGLERVAVWFPELGRWVAVPEIVHSTCVAEAQAGREVAGALRGADGLGRRVRLARPVPDDPDEAVASGLLARAGCPLCARLPARARYSPASA
ncbi:hypothetical protein [Actinosynnema mirum]|uniref:hypothetical protein n=1 Tax=Actinosynnema mirum TaxID=40567 RepID=UPI00019AB18C|nr:hypothetical protein [Actinosynnema mirum]